MMPTATTIAITLHQKRPAEIVAKMGDVFLGRWQVFPGCEVAFVGDVSHRLPHFPRNRVVLIRVKEPIVLFGDHTRETKLIDFDFVVGADGVKLLHPVSLHTAYYFLALQWLPLESRGYGRHFKLLKASFIPLPPLAEQHRIVAKVDELMALCDRLEATLATDDDTRRRLLDALLHEVLVMGADRKSVA